MSVSPFPGHGPKPAFPHFTPNRWSIATPPQREWMVEGCVPKGSVVILAGDGGLGKSLLCQQLMTAAALGHNWLGMPTQKSRSLAVFCEDEPDELHRRQADICAHYGCRMSDLEGVAMASRVGEDSVLMSFKQWGDDSGRETPLFGEIRNAAKAHKANLVFLDTAADVYSGNEIDRVQVRTFIRHLRRLAIELQGAVILTQHPSNEGMNSGSGRSGSTGWHNSVRSRLYLTAPKAKTGDEDKPSDIRHLKTMKANYGKWGGKLEIQWKRGVFEVVNNEPETPYWTRETDTTPPF